jgi:predicted nucleic acid-binding protein
MLDTSCMVAVTAHSHQQHIAALDEIVELNSADYVTLLMSSPARSVVGGQVYDAVIAACAHKGAVDAFLTFNERHFRQFLAHGIELVVPHADTTC